MKTSILYAALLPLVLTVHTLVCSAECPQYSAVLDYKTGIIVDDADALASQGESGKIRCRCNDDAVYRIYMNGELYMRGDLCSFIDWSVDGAHCSIPDPFGKKSVWIHFTNLETERVITVSMDAKRYFATMPISEQGKRSVTLRLVRYSYALITGVIEGFKWIVNGIAFLITLFAMYKFIVLIVAIF